MRVVGIVAEYNPFHYGHLYQIRKVKEMYPDSIIIAIISTNYTQRGGFSLINKWDKTRICLNYGIDMVVELPTLYTTQGADMFAYGAISILNMLHIDTLVFGMECDDVEYLIKAAKTQINNSKYDELVQKYLLTGVNYPTALGNALKEMIGYTTDKPNDLLAISYIKEIIKNNYKIEPVGIKRTNDYHGKEIKSSIVNASLIRDMLDKNMDVSKYVPIETYKCLNMKNFDNGYLLLKYNISNNENRLFEYLTVDEGIENRILKYYKDCDNWCALVNLIKTRRYTYNKVNRMLMHILLNIKKIDNDKEIYLRVLGFNDIGRNYLKQIKKDIDVINTCKQGINKALDIEINATYIYSLVTGDNSLIEREYKNKPIIFH
ncbi:MAG: nucleotidyltransferase [Erysipelotrichaceae bacterium]|nr:nucleotidyltransferase [Erysipelotrichaceae bacterium]